MKNSVDFCLEIPAFLDRRLASGSSQPHNSTISVDDVAPKWIMPKSKKEQSLTVKFKYKIASDLIAGIKCGHDTFGKLFKRFDYTKRELRAGLRFGKSNWIVAAKVVGRGRTRQLSTKQVMIVPKGRFYEIIDY